jgi:hypothetical protein
MSYITLKDPNIYFSIILLSICYSCWQLKLKKWLLDLSEEIDLIFVACSDIHIRFFP